LSFDVIAILAWLWYLVTFKNCAPTIENKFESPQLDVKEIECKILVFGFWRLLMEYWNYNNI